MVHIHDGKVHKKADFDHVLYCQPFGDQHLALGANWRKKGTCEQVHERQERQSNHRG